MNLTPSEAARWFEAAVPGLTTLRDRDLFVLPPFPSIPTARDALHGTDIGWGAQDVHPDDSGAHTGDVSAPMLADLGCRFVEVGHSERRRDHREGDRLIAAKSITWPLLCGGQKSGSARRACDYSDQRPCRTPTTLFFSNIKPFG
jgi:triosephosphate isomerase